MVALRSDLILYAASTSPHTCALYAIDDATGAQRLVKELNSASVDAFFISGDFAYFRASEGLWRTDGTPAGTIAVADVSPHSFAELAGLVHFIATSSDGAGLYVTRGTPESTKRVVSLGPATPETGLVAAAGALFFTRSTEAGEELWASDGTNDGTRLVKDIVPGEGSSKPGELVNGGRYLFFVADDGAHGRELWRTDGTAEGTILLRDIRPGGSSSAPRELTICGETLYFVADDGASGAELWRSDGTVEGTVLGSDLRSSGSSDPKNLFAFDDTLWFAANDGIHGEELWRIAKNEGVTPGATKNEGVTPTMVADLAAGADSSYPGRAVRAGDFLYFAATTPAGRELWAIDLGVRAEGAAGRDPSGVAIVKADDAQADLELEWVSSTVSTHTLRITNHGPAAATNIVVRVSQSPEIVTICGSSANPGDCAAGGLAAGESKTFNVSASTSHLNSYTDPNEPPGTTVTADVRSSETDSNSANNSVSRMIGASLEMPPFLTNGVTSNVLFRVTYSPANVAITSPLSFLTISPDYVAIPAEEKTATFMLTPQNYAGRVLLRTGSSTSGVGKVTIVSVQAGGTPRLDVAAIVDTTIRETYGDPVDIPIALAARRHDGTRPGGAISLVDANGATLAQQTLDGNASTSFSRSGLARGSYNWELRYPGDANFNSLTIPITVTIDGVLTETAVEVPPFFCDGVADVTVRVRDTSASEVPPGTVRLVVNGTAHTLSLSPSGVSGEAIATMRVTLPPGSGSMGAFYDGTARLTTSSGGASFSTGPCGQFTVNAVANGSTVTLTWAPQPGASRYSVRYLYDPYTWAFVDGTEGTQFTHQTGTSGKVFLYSLIATDASGNIVAYSAPEIAYTKAFTDDPVALRVTRLKAAHITELQVAASALRQAIESSGLTFPAATPGTPVRAARILELRDAINKYRSRLGLFTVAWTDPNLAAGSRIKGVHLQELRNALK